MKTLLKMRYSPIALHTAKAWYIAGGDPRVWLDEITRSQIDQAEIRLFPIPRSSSDQRPCGVLVAMHNGDCPTPTERCSAFGKIAGRLFLPTEAWLDPDLSDDELRSLLATDKSFVWHPSAGLIVFESDDVLRMSDLLSVGPVLRCRWDHADPGVVISQRLVSLRPDETLTVEVMLEQGQDDIATEQDGIAELPRSPQEPSPGVFNNAARHGKRLVAGIVHWFTQRVPATSGEPTWIDRLEQWAENQMANFRSGSNAERNKEISRLLHLLDTDPDQGLRFALPMGGDAHRGLAPPENQLDEHNVDFRLGNLGGGQPTDFWDISAQHQYQLTARYRELANRELHLGRHRRAAYIFAELLGDFNAAAAALVAGGHWREAAVLYEQRLGRPAEAARCLEKGGLWTEAITHYEQLQEHEKAGDLYVKLGQQDKARERYRIAVDQHRFGLDLLSAARILETKLDSVDEAIEVLSSGWPDASQARQCLREVFNIQGRIGRHEATRKRIAEFRQSSFPDRHQVELVNIIADTATNYPDRSVQADAADCTRVLVSRQLRNASKSESRQLLSAVSRLVPQDRLLGRDCQRYTQKKPVPPRPQPAKRQPRTKTPALIHSFQLPGKDVSWQKAIVCGSSIFVAGYLDDDLLLTRCSWKTADRPGKIWKRLTAASDLPIVLTACPLIDLDVMLHPIGHPLLTTQHEFQPTDECPCLTTTGAFPGMSESCMAATVSANGTLWILEMREGRLTLGAAAGPPGELISTQTVPRPESSQPDDLPYSVLPIPLHARGDKVYLGINNQVIIFDKDKPLQTIEFSQRITSLVGSAPNTRPRIAATFEEGGTVFWDDYERGHEESFASDMPHPIACFNRGGYLITAGEDRLEVYSTHGRRLKIEAEVTLTTAKPIAVLSGTRPDQFGVVSQSGKISVYQLP